MTTATQGRSLHYRVARFHQIKGTTLQAMLAKALKKLENAQQRLEPLDQTATSPATEHRLINYVTPYKGMLSGNMFVYTKGAAQLLMLTEQVKNEGDSVASYPLEALTAPSQDGKKTEFLESILYFCIHGNHVLVLQSRGLRTRGLEQYLNWVLHKAGELAGEQSVLLTDQPTPKAAAAIQKSKVKAVSVGLPLVTVESATTENKKAKVTVAGPVLEALKGLIGAKEVGHMKLEDALDGNIEATIELRWSRQTTPQAQAVLDNLAVAMRNVDPDEVEIRLNDGTILKGSEMKLVLQISVTVKDSVINQSSLFKAMRDQMTNLLESGTVPPS